MEWLIILALAAWVWRQARRIDALQRRLEALELRAPAPAASDDGDVLVLDTPVPVASNDEPAAEPAPANGDAEFSPDQAALSFPEQAMQRQSEPPSETLLLT